MPDTIAKPLFVITLSGGLDSTTLCADLLARYGKSSILPVFFEYGSTHNPWEKEAAVAVAAYYGQTLRTVDLREAFGNIQSALLAADTRDIPQTPYDEHSMQLTVVPGRNLIFASVLAAIAESNCIPFIALATHGGDHHLYPDCRPAFNKTLAATIAASSGGSVKLEVPFENADKKDIVAMGIRQNAPFHLTRSCYGAKQASCGICGTCRERLEAFEANKIKDPILYM